ncbi:hypothetical protein [Aurantiacibacter sediminis]|uniref:Helix-turn-helix domain-containing protein n=1 Tax=Aurantiacibacter sediminis TaxID=2793064 RepID=A0ABS0N2R2_9SPHN|nr:hypothetical protein [Aurantiacibacter sediminis]MBH5322251.1 hypothetical protein [Aurantiacibacter sediminis]
MMALVPVDTPNPTFGNSEALTPVRMALFLKSMQVMGNVSIACKRAGVARQTAYRARRRYAGFARAWDAALLAARVVAETELADRAINGVEESVYYHGEEVGMRRRYSDRLLLAHLARLDRMAQDAELVAAAELLDDQIEALERGEDIASLDASFAPDAQNALRQAQDERMGGAQDERGGGAPRERNGGAGKGAGNSDQDTVTPVTPPVDPCPDCGGYCVDAEEDARVTLTQDDCMWLGNRLNRMDAARPAGVAPPHMRGLPMETYAAIENDQLLAFEAGEERWWLVGFEDEDQEDADAEEGSDGRLGPRGGVE